MFDILENLSNMIYSNLYIAPLICIVAGFLSALLPCSLTQLPLLIAYLGGYEKGKKNNALKYSLLYALGNTIVFVILGILSALLGKSFSLLNKKVYIILGLLMIIMFFQMTNIINVIPKNLRKPTTNKKGCLGAFVLGIIGGFFTSPCSTPVLIAILSFVVSTESILFGLLMLLCYSIGNGIILVIFGSSITLVDRLTNSKKMFFISKAITILFSIAILVIGMYMLYLGF